jgi:hypothetical protein
MALVRLQRCRTHNKKNERTLIITRPLIEVLQNSHILLRSCGRPLDLLPLNQRNSESTLSDRIAEHQGKLTIGVLIRNAFNFYLCSNNGDAIFRDIGDACVHTFSSIAGRRCQRSKGGCNRGLRHHYDSSHCSGTGVRVATE